MLPSASSYGFARGTNYARRLTFAPLCAGQVNELYVCTNRVCKRQGSQQILKFGQDLGLAELQVKESGCLGNCGNGPNMMLAPHNILLNHVATPNDLATALAISARLELDKTRVQAAELRLAGNALASAGKFEAAIAKYTEGLDVLGAKPGRHLLLCNRSAAHLQAGKKEAALADAQSAVDAAPPDFTTAWVRLIDAYYALGRLRDSAAALERAVAVNPAFKDEPEYTVICKALQQAGRPARA